MTKRKYSGGHMTLADGSHVPLSEADAAAIWNAIEDQKRRDAEAMPYAGDALRAMCRAQERMKRLGWREGIYCPKDGSTFAATQFGSTGVFPAFYLGKWPNGSIMLGDGFSPPAACMWKAIDSLTDDERAIMDQCTADHSAYIDRLGRDHHQV